MLCLVALHPHIRVSHIMQIYPLVVSGYDGDRVLLVTDLDVSDMDNLDVAEWGTSKSSGKAAKIKCRGCTFVVANILCTPPPLATKPNLSLKHHAAQVPSPAVSGAHPLCSTPTKIVALPSRLTKSSLWQKIKA